MICQGRSSHFISKRKRGLFCNVYTLIVQAHRCSKVLLHSLTQKLKKDIIHFKNLNCYLKNIRILTPKKFIQNLKLINKKISTGFIKISATSKDIYQIYWPDFKGYQVLCVLTKELHGSYVSGAVFSSLHAYGICMPALNRHLLSPRIRKQFYAR